MKKYVNQMNQGKNFEFGYVQPEKGVYWKHRSSIGSTSVAQNSMWARHYQYYNCKHVQKRYRLVDKNKRRRQHNRFNFLKNLHRSYIEHTPEVTRSTRPFMIT